MYRFIRTYQLDIMLALSAACFSFALLLIVTQYLTSRRKKILIFGELVATTLLLSDRMAYMYSGDTSSIGFFMVRISNFLVFFLTSAFVLGFNMYLSNLITDGKKDIKIPKRLIGAGIGAIAGMIMVVISQYTGLYYWFDENNVYHRGPGFLLCYFVPILCPLIQYSVIRQYKKHFSKLIYISLVLYIFVPIIMGIIQIFTYGISIVNMAMVAVSISLYVFTYVDINRAAIQAHNMEVSELRAGEEKMKRLFKQTTEAFVKVIERKNPYSKGYSARVANTAKKIAQMAGMDEKTCDEVYYAALLHDVGIIGIPEEIIEKDEQLNEEEREIMKRKPVISGEILSVIEEYPYLLNGVLYSHERYDGSGYPEGLKGKAIPEVARIIGVADAYCSMTSKKKYRKPLPYITVRENFVEQSGTTFDPKYAQIMLQIMDENFITQEEEEPLESEIICKEYKEHVSVGIPITGKITKISFVSEVLDESSEFSSPSLVIFDSYDRHFHVNPKSMKTFRYTEYAEIWPDGYYVSTETRNMEMTIGDKKDVKGLRLIGQKGRVKYEITAAKFFDHVKIDISGEGKNKVSATMALFDNTKEAYIGITGENCRITEMTATETAEAIGENYITRIADPVTFTDRMESDIPNLQIDRTRSAYTEGIKIVDDLKINFHSMSLPSANLVWHCPYFVLFYSDDGKVNGNGYHEYGLLKINGEVTGGEEFADNNFSMKKKEEFKGWDDWKEINKNGVECSALFLKRGNKVITHTDNLGIEIDNTTTILDGHKDVYVALTGDEVAITDIRIIN